MTPRPARAAAARRSAGKPRLITALSLAVFLRWLAVGHVTATIGGATITIPALALAAATVIAAAVAVMAVAVYRLRRDALPPPGRVASSPEGHRQ